VANQHSIVTSALLIIDTDTSQYYLSRCMRIRLQGITWVEINHLGHLQTHSIMNWKLFCLIVLESGAPLSSFLREVLYKWMNEWMNECAIVHPSILPCITPLPYSVWCTFALGSFTTTCSNIGSYRSPPPLSRLGNGEWKRSRPFSRPC